MLNKLNNKTMKRINVLVINCLFLMALWSCGGSGTDKANNAIKFGKNRAKNLEKANNAIQDCLAKNDFEGAHRILNQIPYGNDVISDLDQDPLQDKVYRAEITYLVDQNTDEAWQRAYALVVQYKIMYRFSNEDYELRKKLEISELLSNYVVAFGHEKTAKQLIKYVEGILYECEEGKKNAESYDQDDWRENISKARSIITKLKSV